MFKKGSDRCKVLIPHTVFLSNETINEWYFTSKDGRVLRKSPAHCKIMEVYKSLLDLPEVSYAVTMLQSVKSKPLFEERVLELIQKNAEDNATDAQSVAKLFETFGNSSDWNSTKNKFQTDTSQTSMFQKWQNESNASFTINQITENLKKIKHDAEIKILDSTLPPLAYVRVEVGENRPYKPHELYNLITESLSNVKMIQSLVYYKGSIQLPYSYSTYICEFQHQNNEAGAKVFV